MLGSVLGDVLPSALAVALSPIPIVAVVLVLGGHRPRSAGGGFALGWIAGLSAVAVVVVLLVGAGGDSGGEGSGVAWLKTGVGVLLLLMAVGQWRKRPRGGEEPEMPAWMAGIDAATPARATLLGAALSAANPKNLALTFAASASIAEAGLDGADTAIAVVVFVAVGSATVAGAALAYLVAPARAARPLAAIRRFMSRHNAVIMAAVLALIGAKLLAEGLGGV